MIGMRYSLSKHCLLPIFSNINGSNSPVFVVINVILLSSPPALTLAQITQADVFERLISRTIFWSYCIATPFVMILCVLVALILVELRV